MKIIQIEYSSDSKTCDQCDGGYSEGAVVTVDGVVVLNKPAAASCTESVWVDQEEIMEAIVEHLGYEILETYAN